MKHKHHTTTRCYVDFHHCSGAQTIDVYFRLKVIDNRQCSPLVKLLCSLQPQPEIANDKK